MVLDSAVVQFNVVMVGNSCVGKTSFIRRFHKGQFTEDYRSTIGECCKIKGLSFLLNYYMQSIQMFGVSKMLYYIFVFYIYR